MLPTILNEHQIHQFTFYLDGKVRQGMRHNQEIFGLACTFDVKERLKAYELANVLTEAGCCAIVTVSTQYKIWIQMTPAGYVQWQQCVARKEPPLAERKPNLGKELVTRWQTSHLFQSSSLTAAFA